MTCKNCSKQIADDSLFCNFCGSKVEKELKCSSCGTVLPEGSMFCNKCGTKVDDSDFVSSTESAANLLDLDDSLLAELDDILSGKSSASYNDEDIFEHNYFEDDVESSDDIQDDDDDTVIIPGYIKVITYDYMGKYRNCKRVKIEHGVEEIGKEDGYLGAFSGCESLISVSIPDSVTSISDRAFSGCKSLVEINIPSGTIKLGGWVFSGCDSLVKVTIPESVDVSGRAFDGCDSPVVVHCTPGSSAEKAALQAWKKVKYIDSAPFMPAAARKPVPGKNGRVCGAYCFNFEFGGPVEYNGNEYEGWYYDVFYDNSGVFHLVRFDEDEVNSLNIIYKDNMSQLPECGEYDRPIIQANREGVFVCMYTNILCFSHDGQLLHNIDTVKLLPELETYAKKDFNRWKRDNKERGEKYAKSDYNCKMLYTIWVYGKIIYFTTGFDDEKGMVYRYDIDNDYAESFKINKPRNSNYFSTRYITGNDRYILIYNGEYHNREYLLYDTLMRESRKTNAFYIDFENNVCYYTPDTVPLFTPEGFRNAEIPYKLYKYTNNESYSGKGYEAVVEFNTYSSVFTGDEYYGFRSLRTEDLNAVEHPDHNNLYRYDSENGWTYLKAGAGGASFMSSRISRNYIYFDAGHGFERARLDGGGLQDRFKDAKDFAFRRLALQDS